MTIETVDL